MLCVCVYGTYAVVSVGPALAVCSLCSSLMKLHPCEPTAGYGFFIDVRPIWLRWEGHLSVVVGCLHQEVSRSPEGFIMCLPSAHTSSIPSSGSINRPSAQNPLSSRPSQRLPAPLSNDNGKDWDSGCHRLEIGNLSRPSDVLRRDVVYTFDHYYYYVCVYVCMYVCVCMYIYIYIYIYDGLLQSCLVAV